MTVTVLGAGERVRVVGWSRRPIGARAWSPVGGSSEIIPAHDAVTGMWELMVDVPDAGWAQLHVRLL